ncbi:UDP-glucose/GDP-mannose dehydrogenase family protein [Dermacoccus abyssi]|uniref:UDP-glucose 6-dehydrogenase n=1 Tax=Dermacoccus abyssi TaxID=322596 RepID=A0ABX5ZAK8_9MICO|nr:UDP-glucose/GDP-mannose dehydrogenase family protein [Dermacoccus abyssi]
MSLKISVIGTGYLGAVHAACMAELGHTVVGIDTDASKIEALAAGRSPIYEPGLPELLTSTGESGRLTWSTDISAAADADVHFVCVGTPQRAGEYAANTDYVFAAFTALAPHMKAGSIAVGKSTVPVGTVPRVLEAIRENVTDGIDARLVWNPEFLREGFAVKDTLTPDRFVYGVEGEFADADVEKLDEVYDKALAAGTPRLVTNYATAELVKVSANAFLATKISFINAMAEICEATGGDVLALADAIGHDERIGRKFLGAGVGFGGGCLPKDIRAFLARGEELGLPDSVAFLRGVDATNLRRRERVVTLVEGALGDVAGKPIAVLGAAFKPNSDDIRDSPALDVAERLVQLGADVRVHDPEALPVARANRPGPNYVDTVDEALDGAQIVLHLTEWKQYRELDPAEVATKVANKVVIDGRNALDGARWADAGFTVHSLGRPVVEAR